MRDAAHYGDEGLTYGPTVAYGQQLTAFSNWKYPFDTALVPEFLTTGLTEPGTILRRNQDYIFEDGLIVFLRDPLELTGILKRLTSYREQTPMFSFVLWGFQVQDDIDAVCDYFGTVAGICGSGTAVMQEAVNVAWGLRTEGATVRNVKRMLSILTRTEYAKVSGVVRDVYGEGDSICVRTDVDVYTAPADAAVLVNIGDALTAGQLIFDSFAVHEGWGDIEFADFEGVTLDPGFVQETQGPLFFPNQQVDVVKIHDPNWVRVEAV